MKQRQSILILDNVRSVYNVGAIFRTAEAAGISKIYLIGYTPTPVDRFGRERGDVAKAALGAQKMIQWEKKEKSIPLIRALQKDGFTVIAIEQDKKSVDYKKVKPKLKTAFILGNEVSGLSKTVLDEVDVISEIPMQGRKESLNVSVSTGIAIFRILNI